MGRRDAQGLRAVPGALRPRRAGRLRRDPAARARAAARQRRRCWRTTASASASCWSTSSRTPTASSTRSCACSPATPATCSWSATTTRRSTAGAAPRSRTCSGSCSDFPGAQHHPPGAELPLQRQHPRRRQRGDRAQPRRASASSCGPTAAKASRSTCTPPTTRSTRRASWSSASRQWVRDGGSYRRRRDALPQQRAVARVRGGAAGGAGAVPRLRRPALLRARRNQGHAGLPAPGRQPRRRRGVRARGQHARRAASANARSTRCAGARAATACRCGRRRSASSREGMLAARARNALAGFHRADRRARGRSRRAAAARTRSTTCCCAPACASTTPTNRRASSIRASTTSTNWSRSLRASSSGDDDEAAALTELVAFLAYAALEAGEGQAAGRRGRRAADDAAQRQGPGIPAGVPRRPGGRPVPERALGRRRAGRLEEERRLAYVGITRARQKLVLSYAESRRIHGQDMYGMPSRFLREIPSALLHEVRPKVQVSRPMYSLAAAPRLRPRRGRDRPR